MQIELHQMKEVMPGCKLLQTTSGLTMFGCPSEAVKVLDKDGFDFPDRIVLPDQFYLHRVVQADLEFPLYKFLFVLQKFFKGIKLRVIGTPSQISRMRKILQLTLLGPTEKQMIAWRIDKKTRQEILKMSQAFALKKLGTQEIAQIDDMIEFVAFDNDDVVKYGDVQIKILDSNVFEVVDSSVTNLIDINIASAQQPPIPIQPPKKLGPRAKLGATSLSKCTTGFDQSGYTSGIVFWLNGLGVSVDGVSWMKEHLLTMGINPREIVAHIITHKHGDHSNICDLIVNGKPFVSISDRLGHKCLVYKLSLILDIPEKKVEKMIKWVKVNLNKPLEWYGATFEFWRTIHPVPTLGFRVTVDGKSIVYSGDTVWGSNLKPFTEILSAKTCSKVMAIPEMGSDLTFMDCGGGMIHPPLSELVSSLSEQALRRIVPTHLEEIPEEFADQFKTIAPGQNWEILAQKKWHADDFFQVTTAPILDSVDSDWKPVLVSQGVVREFAPKEILLEHGEAGKDFFLLLGGTVDVVINNERVARLSTGDFFGEMSLMYDQPCNATIRAISPVRALLVPGNIFLQMIRSCPLGKNLPKMHQLRPILLQVGAFRDLPSEIQNNISFAAEEQSFAEGDIIIRQGEVGDKFYVIKKGRVSIFHKMNGSPVADHIATLYRNHVFGEQALLGDGFRTADVVATTEVTVFSLSKKVFQRIVGSVPMLFYGLGKLADDRQRKTINR